MSSVNDSPAAISPVRRVPGIAWAAVIAACYGLVTMAATAWSSGFPDPLDLRSLGEAALVAVVVLTAFLALMRWPVACFLVVCVAVFQLRFMNLPVGFGVETMLIPAGYHLGRRTRTWPAVILAMVATVVGVAASAVQYRTQLTATGMDGVTMPQDMHYSASIILGFFTGHLHDVLLPVLAGIVVKRQLVRAEAVQARAVEARAEADAALVAALRADRERLARELHDLAAHHSTAAVITAKAARKVNAQDPATAGNLIDDVVTETQAAQSSLRQMVRVLHDPDDGVPLHPQPRLDEITALVGRARQINPDIVLEAGDLTGIPASDSTALAAVRIVQESLTNTHRHAPGAPVTVSVERDGDWLLVEVVNGRSSRLVDDAGLGMGQGIAGMRQRAGLLGGNLEAGPHGRGWRVSAELPLNPVEESL
ncbi:signal transduction histidine kinase [Luteococcus japonicus]|uniref:histidine kinase n=1 Tax=Luteococcus japonicus TaxID=33984 RepID=A0A3N1ZSJ6_9ACTN|nr:signal transduction histidine kinase [Luteococcus japonicus]